MVKRNIQWRLTYLAGAVFSLADDPCLSDCKYAKMNQTLTATYSRWKAGVNDPFIHATRTSALRGEINLWRGMNVAADGLGYKRNDRSSPAVRQLRRTAPVGVTTVKSHTVSRKTTWKKNVECLDASTNEENSPLYVIKTETPIRKEVVATTECVSMHPSERCCPWWVAAVWALARSPQANILTRCRTAVSLRYIYKPTRLPNIDFFTSAVFEWYSF